MKRILKGLIFAASFYLLVCTLLYPPLYLAPGIAASLRNQADFDPIQTGGYRGIFLSSSGIFTLILYACLLEHIPTPAQSV